MSQLCDFPTDQAMGCCEPAAVQPAAPIRPSNLPRLDQIAYRIGTFGSFRRAMLDSLAKILPGWQQAEAGQDYATMFIELWAYIADVLTFYQERIANEAYLGTATQRDSLLRLAQLIDYRAGPGAAANVLLAFSLAKDKAVTVPSGLRVSSKPAAGKAAAIFETDAAIHALTAHNSIALAKVGVANQFVTLEQNAGAQPNNAILVELAAVSKLSPANATRLVASASLIRIGRIGGLGGGGGGTTAPPPPAPIRKVTFQGLNLRLRPGDWLLIMAGADHKKAVLQQISTSAADPHSKTTTVSWVETADPGYGTADPAVYAFRAEAQPFGHDVPDQPTVAQAIADATKTLQAQEDARATAIATWKTPPSQTLVLKERPAAVLGGGSGGGQTSPMLPEDSSQLRTLHLDGIYDGVAPSAGDSHSMLVLQSPSTQEPFVTEVKGVAKVTHVNYGLRSRVSELTLFDAITGTFAARDTTVLLRSEQLILANSRPLPDPAGGSVVLLEGIYSQLAPGQRVIIQGTNFDTKAFDAEDGMIETVSTDAGTGTTSVVLHAPLSNSYVRAETALRANVAPASQGEKVRDEVLGSGDGSPWQSYTLRKSPLTYVQAPALASEAAVVSTLELIVSGVMWSERPNLLDAGPADRVFVTSEDASGKTSVAFGDGTSGVRPATGKDNIHARYRKGLGLVGNVDARGIAQLVDAVPGLQAVTNPEPAVGGADRESEDQIRTNAPSKLRTFNRAVALNDFAALALTFPGIAMASAAWQGVSPLPGLDGTVSTRSLSQPTIRLTIGTTNGKRLDAQGDYATRLRRFLDSRRDVNIPLVLRDYDAAWVDMAATIDVDDAYGRQATLRAAIAALNYRANADGSPAFFAEFGFGQAVNASAVYAALQAVTGVRAATVTTLRRVSIDTDPKVVRSVIPIGPFERAVIGNLAEDTSNQFGKLAISLGVGGFAD